MTRHGDGINNLHMEVGPKQIFGNKKLLLASASPRRRELLGMIGAEVHQACIKNVNESYPHDLAPEEVAPFISKKKAEAYATEMEPGEILVTADTVVIDGGKVLGKPRDAADAVSMLKELSGHVHKVVTGVTLLSSSRIDTFSETTYVEFAELSDEEIADYVEHYRPFDKAGAYGIQEWIGYIGVTGIRGDYYNVMGLPLRKLYEYLKKM